MTAQTSMLHVRIDDDTKMQASEALAAIGLSVSEAVRLFLHRVAADKQFPLELKVPNTETRAAMAEADAMIKTRRPRFATADELFAHLDKNIRK